MPMREVNPVHDEHVRELEAGKSAAAAVAAEEETGKIGSEISAALLDASLSFSDDEMGLDERLVRACADVGWVRPTVVQAKAMPLLNSGRDLLMRAQTGSGKTGAYLLGGLQAILSGESSSGVRLLVLVPNRELVAQTAAVADALTRYCRSSLGPVARLDGSRGLEEETAALGLGPSIVVSTPGRLVMHLRSQATKGKRVLSYDKSTHPDLWSRPGGAKLLSGVRFLVIDEADLCAGYGHAVDLRKIAAALPGTIQSVITSATLPTDVDALRRLLLRRPAVLRLDSSATDGKLEQFVLPCSSKDRWVLLIALIKLGILRGRAVIFCNDVDEAYRLRLVLSSFVISAAVWNPQLPVASRNMVLDRFNHGEFDFLVAAESAQEMERASKALPPPSSEVLIQNDDDDDEEEDDEKSAPKKKTSKKESSSDEEEEEDEVSSGGDDKDEEESSSDDDEKDDEDESSSDDEDDDDDNEKEEEEEEEDREVDATATSARGLDLVGVTTVVNWDVPLDVNAYRHRVGRAGRAGRSGVALTLINPFDPTHEKLVQELQSTLPRHPVSGVPLPQPLPFDPREVDGFRYRVSDAVRAAGTSAVRAARLAELQAAMASSERLQAHFEDNPRDLAVLSAKAATAGVRHDPANASVPSYLLAAVPGQSQMQGAAEAATLAKAGSKRKRDKAQRHLSHPAAEPQQLADAAAVLLNPDAAPPPLRRKLLGQDVPAAGRNKWRRKHKKSVGRSFPNAGSMASKLSRSAAKEHKKLFAYGEGSGGTKRTGKRVF